MFRRKPTLTFDSPSHFLARCHRIGRRWHLNGDTTPQDLSSVLPAEKLTCISTARATCHTGLRHHDSIPSNIPHRAKSSNVGNITHASQVPGSLCRPRGHQGSFVQAMVRPGPPLTTSTPEAPLLSQSLCLPLHPILSPWALPARFGLPSDDGGLRAPCSSGFTIAIRIWFPNGTWGSISQANICRHGL